MSEKLTQNPTHDEKAAKLAAKERRSRIPMSAPRRKLEMVERPGYRRYWFNDYPGRIQQALAAGYSFVEPDQAYMDYYAVGDSGNEDIPGTDLGTRVSVVVGSFEGRPLRAYAMEIRNEWFQEDQAALESINEKYDAAIRRDGLGSEKDSAADREARYVKESNFELKRRL